MGTALKRFRHSFVYHFILNFQPLQSDDIPPVKMTHNFRQQAIAWTNVAADLCPYYMASLGHNTLTYCAPEKDNSDPANYEAVKVSTSITLISGWKKQWIYIQAGFKGTQSCGYERSFFPMYFIKMGFHSRSYKSIIALYCYVKTSRSRQNGHHFADDISKCILSNESVWSINIMLYLYYIKNIFLYFVIVTSWHYMA